VTHFHHRLQFQTVIPEEWEHFKIQTVGEKHGNDIITIESHHQRFVCAEKNHSLVADRETAQAWEEFELVIVKG